MDKWFPGAEGEEGMNAVSHCLLSTEFPFGVKSIFANRR